jgi:hypothetical protein
MWWTFYFMGEYYLWININYKIKKYLIFFYSQLNKMIVFTSNEITRLKEKFSHNRTINY